MNTPDRAEIPQNLTKTSQFLPFPSPPPLSSPVPTTAPLPAPEPPPGPRPCCPRASSSSHCFAASAPPVRPRCPSRGRPGTATGHRFRVMLLPFARYLFVLMPRRALPRWRPWLVRFSFGLVIVTCRVLCAGKNVSRVSLCISREREKNSGMVERSLVSWHLGETKLL